MSIDGITEADKYCHIHESRGYGYGVYKVTQFHPSNFPIPAQCTVQSVAGGDSFVIDASDLYTTPALRNQSAEEKISP